MDVNMRRHGRILRSAPGPGHTAKQQIRKCKSSKTEMARVETVLCGKRINQNDIKLDTRPAGRDDKEDRAAK